MFSVIKIIAVFLVGIKSVEAMYEEDRLREYHAREYEWPLKKFVPDTPGWKTIFERRFEQIEQTIENTGPRYDAWVQAMASALVQPNFTENGWGLARAPDDLVQELKQKLHDNLATAPKEKKVNVIESETEENRPLFIQNYELNAKVLRDLKPMHEEWAGVELVGAIAYGLRVYQNNSRLLMHVDKSNTHVISCILHIDHSEDSEDWPIVIEDFQGNTNEVVLESGDMLFYESSKCLHGRPHTFKGSWYSSIFVHYYPVGWKEKDVEKEVHYAIPPHWSKDAQWETDHDKLVMSGTSFKEPDCKNVWCALENSVKWRGPAIEGEVITTGWEPSSTGASDKGERSDEL